MTITHHHFEFECDGQKYVAQVRQDKYSKVLYASIHQLISKELSLIGHAIWTKGYKTLTGAKAGLFRASQGVAYL